MENIFIEIYLQHNFYDVDVISNDLHFYLYNYLFNQNNTFRLDLQTALKINANE